MDYGALAAAAAARVAARGAPRAADPTARDAEADAPLVPVTPQTLIKLASFLKLWRTRLPACAPAAADLLITLEPSLELALIRSVAPLILFLAYSRSSQAPAEPDRRGR